MILAMTGALRAAEDKALEGRESVTTAKERLVNKDVKATSRRRKDGHQF